MPDDSSRAMIVAGIQEANIPALIATLRTLSSDTRWHSDAYRPTRGRGIDEHNDGGLSADRQAEVRDAAREAILEWIDTGEKEPRQPTKDQALDIAQYALGEPVTEQFGAVVANELAAVLGSTTSVPSAAPEGSTAIVVGAGASGISAAIALLRRGWDVTVLEQADAVGGTWHANRYPGVAADTPSHLYSLTEHPHDWSRHFAAGGQIQSYLAGVADQNGVTQRVRLGRTVTRAEWDDNRRVWSVESVDGDDQSFVDEAALFITGVGGFVTPSLPNIPGIDTFRGELHHSATWSASTDLTGARVAVIGTGASAMQLVPVVARVAQAVTVFQRTPQWIAPFPYLGLELPDGVRALMRACPIFRAWYRIRLAWVFGDRVFPTFELDPSWHAESGGINKMNDANRRYLTRYVTETLEGRPDLLANSVPDYPPYAKRILLDNGWFEALQADQVELVPAGADAITSDGVRAGDTEYGPFDHIVFATGFDVSHFLKGIEIIGRDGQRLDDIWKGDDGRAFLGMAIPGFPNLFTLYGPNLQPAAGSVIFMVERQVSYFDDLLERTGLRPGESVEVTQTAFDRYQEEIDNAHRALMWSVDESSSYYRNSAGRIVVVNPFSPGAFSEMTEQAQLEDWRVARSTT